MEREPNGALTSFSGAPDELLIRVFAAPAAGVQELPDCLARQRDKQCINLEGVARSCYLKCPILWMTAYAKG